MCIFAGRGIEINAAKGIDRMQLMPDGFTVALLNHYRGSEGSVRGCDGSVATWSMPSNK